MRRDPNALGEENRVLVFIAGSVGEAQRVETVLTSDGIDYCLLAEEFTQGILSSMRTGLGCYVVEAQASVARRRLAEANLQSGIIDADPGEQRALADIEQYGCHVMHLLAEGDLPPFSYSVGIQRSSGAPELIVIGLNRPLAHFIVNEYNFKCSNWSIPPPLVSGHGITRRMTSSVPSSHSLRNLKTMAHANNRPERARVARAAQLVRSPAMREVSLFEDMGFVEIPNALTAGQCRDLASSVDDTDGGRAGSRNLLELPCCMEVASTLKAHAHIGPLLPREAVAVQCTLFDKSSDRNWLVALHQDLSIPVRERVDHTECAGWSEKEGVLYVQPPVPMLEALVAVRVHLDDCRPQSGPLRVVPRSHRHGRLSADEAKALRNEYGEVECIGLRGGVLVMRPLLLHSSSKTRVQSRRRVLHFLFGPSELTCGLRWHRAV